MDCLIAAGILWSSFSCGGSALDCVEALHEMVGTESSGAGGAAPGGGQPPFDFSALQNVLADPSIKQMAEQIASAPEFAQMTQVRGDCAGTCKVSACCLASCSTGAQPSAARRRCKLAWPTAARQQVASRAARRAAAQRLTRKRTPVL